jgi:hypothetical protein
LYWIEVWVVLFDPKRGYYFLIKKRVKKRVKKWGQKRGQKKGRKKGSKKGGIFGRFLGVVFWVGFWVRFGGVKMGGYNFGVRIFGVVGKKGGPIAIIYGLSF